MEKVSFDRFHDYQEITELMQGWAAAYPQLTRLHSAGKSPEGRELWVMELTNQATGEAKNKPAYFVKGNHHAGEVTGSAAALYTIQYLLHNFGQDTLCTTVLDTRVMYIMPRITMDGSEVYLHTAKQLRSAARPFPSEEQADGFYAEDVNGDGRMLQMRIRDDSGEWKVSERDPRLMVRRAPDEYGGTYYRLLPEGSIKNYDGVEIKMARPLWGLDFNRNYPTNWMPDHRQRGAGVYPFSEPEIKAVAEFFLNHTNICGSMSYHTTGAVILRPLCTMGDDKLSRVDMALYKAIGEMGTEATGYPMVSVYHDFTARPEMPEIGSYLEWVYEALGILGFEVELWDMPKHAGIEKRGFKAAMNKTAQELEEDGLKLLAWNDKELQGQGFIDWQPFEHPQLGLVEIGGWEPKYVRQNIPSHLLEEEIKGNAIFTIRHCAASPLMEIEKLTCTKVEGDIYRLQLTAANTGFLPTNVTDMALRIGVAKQVEAALELADGVDLVEGNAKVSLGHLAGHSRKQVSWVVKGSGSLRLTVKSEKGGLTAREINLE